MFSTFAETKLYRRASYLLFPVKLGILSLMPMLLIKLLIFTTDTVLDSSLVDHILFEDTFTTLATWFLFSLVLTWLVYKSAPTWVQLGHFLDARHFGHGGKARFAGMLEEYTLRLDLQSQFTVGHPLFYGTSLFNPAWKLGESSDQHMLTIGGSGTGKGTSAIIPNLLSWRGNAIIVDPKGTNAHVTAYWRCHDLMQNVVVLDPFGSVDIDWIERHGNGTFQEREIDTNTPKRGRFNPLSEIDPKNSSAASLIGNLAEALIVDDGTKDKYFINMPRTIIAGYIAHLVSTRKNPTLNDLFNMIVASDEEKDRLHAAMAMNPACGGRAQLAGQEISNGGGTTALKNHFSSIRTQLEWLTDEYMTATLAETDFDMNRLATTYGDMSIYVVLPPHMMPRHRVFLRLVLATALNVHLKNEARKSKTLFLIDEAAQLGRFEMIEQGFNLSRSYGLLVWPVFQSKSQIDELYGAAANSFFSSSRAVQIFGVAGAAPGGDAYWAAQQLGTRGLVDDVTHTSAVMALRDPASVVREIGGGYGKQYILRRDAPHLLLERRPYYSSILFATRAGLDPDHPKVSGAARRGRFWHRRGQIIGGAIGSCIMLTLVGAFILTGLENRTKITLNLSDNARVIFEVMSVLGAFPTVLFGGLLGLLLIGALIYGSYELITVLKERIDYWIYLKKNAAGAAKAKTIPAETTSPLVSARDFGTASGLATRPTHAPVFPVTASNLLDWRTRFSEIFDPENGFHSNNMERREVWHHFEFLLDDMPEHKLASHWHRLYGERFPNYIPLLGEESTQKAVQ